MEQGASSQVTLTLRAKLLVLLLAVGGLAALAVSYWHRTQSAHYAELFAQQQAEGARNLEEIVRLKRSSLQMFSSDYAHWDEMVTAIGAASADWGRLFEAASLRSFEVDVVGVFGPDRQVRYSIVPEGLPVGWLEEVGAGSSGTGRRNFFLKVADHLLEISMEPVHPQRDLDRSGPPAGWLAVGRVWDEAFLDRLIAIPFSAPRIIRSGGPLPESAPEEARMVGILPLPQSDGTPAAFLVAETSSVLFQSLRAATRFQAQSLTIFGSVLFLVLLLSLQFWIVSPLDRLTLAVKSGKIDGLTPLLGQQSEFGVLARLLADHFHQARTLTDEMAARLTAQEKIIGLNHEKELIAREIHDNVIQSLYGIGLRLAWAKKAFSHDPAKAMSSLEGAVGDVDQAMHNLRLFLNSIGDKPGSTDHTWQAVRNILTRMRETGLLDVEIQIDRDALAMLSPAQGFHLVRIVNEACANVLKHADASEIRVEFASDPDGFHLIIADDGCGILPGREAGYGLGNMRRRAEELGGNFQIDTAPGEGTRLKVDLPRDPHL